MVVLGEAIHSKTLTYNHFKTSVSYCRHFVVMLFLLFLLGYNVAHVGLK